MSRLRTLREAAGLTQRELAQRAGVSRQLVGTVETGRHVPRVDAALALAHALDADVSWLFSEPESAAPVDVVSGARAVAGSVVRAARVGDRVVTAPPRVSSGGFDVADVTVGGDGALTASIPDGFVIAGCEPALLMLERVLCERGTSAMAVNTASASARAALTDGRTHAAVVHGSPAWRADEPPDGVVVYRLGAWRVGLSAAADSPDAWWSRALAGDGPVIQREDGAGVQRSFVSARTSPAPVAGPRVSSHIEAASASLLAGLPAVTIEPAALAVGAVFHPLDLHTVELWIDERWIDLPSVRAAIGVLGERRLLDRLRAVGGYDLSRWGDRVA